MTERYINPHTDFGFKRLFGSEFNKELLISFLNALFRGEQDVKDVTYLNSEQLEKFIVEMQNVYQEFLKDRTIYYSTFPIREQAQRGGNWDFHLSSVYTIGLLNFNFAEGLEEAQHWHHEVKLMEVDTKKVFYDKLTYIYVEIPKFDKTEDQLVTMYDKWMFVLKNLSVLMERPAALQERVFTSTQPKRIVLQRDAPKDMQKDMPRDALRALQRDALRDALRALSSRRSR